MVNGESETQIRALLNRYCSRLEMLDLLWQWAKYDFGDDEDAIRGNIMRRYELTPAQAVEVVKKCKEECSTLVQSHNVDLVRQAMLSAMSPDYEHKLSGRILSEASRASFSARCAIGLVNWLAAEGTPSGQLEYLFSGSSV